MVTKNLLYKSYSIIQGGFLTGSALKVLSVEDGKIPTNKVKAKVCHGENGKFQLELELF